MTMTITMTEYDYNYDCDYASPYKINIFLSNLLYTCTMVNKYLSNYSSQNYIFAVVFEIHVNGKSWDL